MITLTPTNVIAYRQCPFRFNALYIRKSIKIKPTKAMVRGTVIHKHLENLLKGKQEVPHPSDWPLNTHGDPVDDIYVLDKLEELKHMAQTAYDMKVEYTMALDDQLNNANRSRGSYLRTRCDVLLIGEDDATLVDWKTGSPWDPDAFQVRLMSLFVNKIFKKDRVNCFYCYVDSGETKSELVDFSMEDLSDVLETLERVAESDRSDVWPRTVNRFCHCCELSNCPNRWAV
jgi:hypothetical protein